MRAARTASLSPALALHGTAFEPGSPSPSLNLSPYAAYVATPSTATATATPSYSYAPLLPPPAEIPRPGPSLFAQGVALLSPEGGQNPTLAFAKFGQALNRLPKKNQPGFNWYATATCLNNLAVSLRQASRYDDALIHIKQAWAVTVCALVDEKKRLDSMGMYLGDSWMDLVVTILDLDKSEDWVRYSTAGDEPESEEKYTGKGKGVPGRSDTVWSQPDDFNKTAGLPHDPENSKVIHGPPLVVLFLDLTTNWGNILFNLGDMEGSITLHSNCLRLAETVFEYFPLDPDFRMSFPLAMSHRFSTTMTGGLFVNSPNLEPRRRNTNHTTFNLSSTSRVSMDDTSSIASGTTITPSFVTIGNPPPTSSTPPPASSSPSPLEDPHYPNPPKDKRIILSFLHRSIILAQARSLTHLSACCQILGLDDAALQCNSHALEIISFYKKMAVIGAKPLTPQQEAEAAAAAEATAASNCKVSLEDSDIAALNTVTSTETGSSRVANSVAAAKRKKVTLEDMFQAQQARLEKTKLYVKETVDPLQGTILANLAVSYYAKGRIASSFDHLTQAASIFKSANYQLSYTRTLSSVHALKVELGRSLKGLHWIRNMESQAIGQAEVSECTRYWGPPRMKGVNLESTGAAEPDTFANVYIGSAWAYPGLKGLKSCFLLFKEKDDLLGMLNCMVNMATAHLLNGQPYLALHILGSLLTEETASGLSLQNTSVAKTTGQAKIPEVLRIHVHYTLCQAVFLVLRLQHTPTHELFPQAIFFENESLLFCEVKPINDLLPALDLELNNFLELDMLCVAFLTSIQDLEQRREDIRSDIPYSLLYSYIGESGFFGHMARLYRSVSTNGQPGSSASQTLEQRQQQQQHMYGIGVGMDFYTQQAFLMRALMGKNDWVNAGGIYKYEGYNHVVMYYSQGIQKLDTTAKDAMQLLRTGTGDDGSYASGLISTLHDTTLNVKTMPPLCPEVIHGGGPMGLGMGLASLSLGSEPVMRFTAAMQSSLFVAPVLYSVSADVMAFGAYQMQAPQTVGTFAGEGLAADLLGVLRIPATPQPAKVHKDLLEAACHTYRGFLGMCELCLKDMLKDPDAYGELVFVSRNGAMVSAYVDQENGGDVIVGGGLMEAGKEKNASSVQGVRNSLNLDGKHMFPCRHFYV
ncbi:hypothetical protein HDU79_010978 [Rhizoclosmatium sp. JEL0117]|nr:hypothetical protein HDU79_010978 [Rhizoclosmatium sp. JEL0117]